MLKKLLLTLFLLSTQILLVVYLLGATPLIIKTDKINTPVISKNSNYTGLLIPLDSRPPCKEFTQNLAKIAGINLTVPPKYLLDDYRTPSQSNALRQWLYNSIASSPDFAILSTDMLMHGGLIASRDVHSLDGREQTFIELLEILKSKSPNTSLAAFTIIPRLLISENDDTKTWQYHMMQYAILKDKVNTFENPLDFQELQKIQLRLPEKLVNKYNNIYLTNDSFNKNLFKAIQNDLVQKIIVGQDDGEVFGLPNTNRHKAELYLEHLNSNQKTNAYTTRGADEIAQLFIAQYTNEIYSTSPKIYIQYSDAQTKNKIMPYMPSSVDETAREKIKIIKGNVVNDKNTADFILFIHCGDQKNSDFFSLTKISQNLNELLANNKNIALVDLSENFEAQETLLDSLIKNNVPLSKLIAYAGWNTTSNSIGTAVSQASIFTARKKHLPVSEHLQLYYLNSNFTLSRIIEDWGYLKIILPQTNKNLKLFGIDNYKLNSNKQYTESLIQNKVQFLANNLLYQNFSRYPFYQLENTCFFFHSVKTTVNLPWDRTFEINLKLETTISKTNNSNAKK